MHLTVTRVVLKTSARVKHYPRLSTPTWARGRWISVTRVLANMMRRRAVHVLHTHTCSSSLSQHAFTSGWWEVRCGIFAHSDTFCCWPREPRTSRRRRTMRVEVFIQTELTHW